jgi:hypothetical protein
MTVRYQNGYLRCKPRHDGSACWEFMWREHYPSGKRVHRTIVIGTIEQYPTESSARAAVNGLRMHINAEQHRQHHRVITVGDLIDHYLLTELPPGAIRHSHATRTIYREFLVRWIKPHWGIFNIRDIAPLPLRPG